MASHPFGQFLPGTQLELTLPSAKTGGCDRRAPTVVSKVSPAEPTEVYDTYWRFACERQAVFFRRLIGARPPWTDDAILQEYKFTNAYRASDRVSQYLIRNVIYQGEQSAEELFFRILLFKLFNRIQTWEILSASIGEISHKRYRFREYDDVLSRAMAAGTPIYSAAYIMPSGPASGEPRKHRHHLRLLESMMADELPQKIAGAKSMQDAFRLLRSYPSIGDFLAYQFVTDLNYSPLTNFSECDFTVPGPGARDGLRKCFRSFGGLNEAELIRLVCDRQQEELARLGLNFQTLWGRPLQYIDCQNLFCEVDKYSRVFHPDVAGRTGRTRIKQRFTPLSQPVIPWYPPKWGINHQIPPMMGDGNSSGDGDGLQYLPKGSNGNGPGSESGRRDGQGHDSAALGPGW